MDPTGLRTLRCSLPLHLCSGSRPVGNCCSKTLLSSPLSLTHVPAILGFSRKPTLEFHCKSFKQTTTQCSAPHKSEGGSTHIQAMAKAVHRNGHGWKALVETLPMILIFWEAAFAVAGKWAVFLRVVMQIPGPTASVKLLVKFRVIPGNTGCIARTCAAAAVGLHLIEPLGFQIDDTKLKRAGLDYWPYVVVKVHGSWAEFREYFQQQEGKKRLLAFTKRGTTIHSNFSYMQGDWLVFGSETCGLPPEALLDCNNPSFGGGAAIRIPMVETYVRCLNLSVSVGIALYEASRQLNYQQLQVPDENCTNNHQNSFMSEDLFT